MPPTPQASGLHLRTAAHERHALAPHDCSPNATRRKRAATQDTLQLRHQTTRAASQRRFAGLVGRHSVLHRMRRAPTVGPRKANGIEERKRGRSLRSAEESDGAHPKPSATSLGSRRAPPLRTHLHANQRTNKQTNCPNRPPPLVAAAAVLTADVVGGEPQSNRTVERREALIEEHPPVDREQCRRRHQRVHLRAAVTRQPHPRGANKRTPVVPAPPAFQQA